MSNLAFVESKRAIFCGGKLHGLVMQSKCVTTSLGVSVDLWPATSPTDPQTAEIQGRQKLTHKSDVPGLPAKKVLSGVLASVLAEKVGAGRSAGNGAVPPFSQRWGPKAHELVSPHLLPLAICDFSHAIQGKWSIFRALFKG